MKLIIEMLAARFIRAFVCVVTLAWSALAPPAFGAAPDALAHEGVVAAPVDKVWAAFTTREGQESWMVAHSDIELKVGGRMRTHYDPKGVLGDAKTIENRPNANVINTLQGQLAGVNITAGSGQPGSKSTVVIRGLGTYNGNTDPLYVIDGFPSNSDNFRSINPNDIASVDVLKDASAISEYGSRGSNGVIVIKTRKGKFGEAKTTFRYSTSYGVSDLQKPKYNYATSKQLLRIERNFGQGFGAVNPVTGSPFTDAEINAYSIQTDWVKYFFRKGISSSNNLSIENSSKNLNSYTSVSYFNQEGVLLTTGLKRFTVRNNINGKSNNRRNS